MLRTARLTGAHWRRVAAARLLSTRAEATTSVVLDKATIRRNHLLEAFTFVRAYATAGFDESVQASLVLNVDIKRTEERVRGRVSLPHGTGKAVRLAVFTRDHAQEALDAGADVVGLEELVAQVVGGTIDFERCIATPDAMPALAKAARVLGPKQLMPSTKRETVVTEVAAAVARIKGGEVTFKASGEGKQAVVHGGIGLVSWGGEKIADNTLAFLDAVLDCRPQRFKGKPPLNLYLNSVHGPRVMLDHRLW